MEQRTPVNRPQGNFTMNINFKRGRNSDGPPITGRISTPEDPDKMYNFSAFAHEEADKLTGEMRTYYIGPVNMATNLREALAKTNERGTHFVAIRQNQFKVFATLEDGKPNPEFEALSTEDQEKEMAKPDWWAKWTRDVNAPVLDASAWERDANRYGPWASGNTQHHMTKEQIAQAEELATGEEPTRAAKTLRSRDRDTEMAR